MTFTLELTPAQEARLRAEAARAGIEPAALLLSRAGLDEMETGVGAGELSQFQAWQERWIRSLPPAPLLGEEDMSRDALYARDDDREYQPQESVPQ